MPRLLFYHARIYRGLGNRMIVQAKTGRKFHTGKLFISLPDATEFYKSACNQTSTGMRREPRADEVTCRKCLRKIAKGLQDGA